LYPKLQDALSKTVPIWAAVLNRAVARIHNGNASAADKVTISHESDVHLPHWISGNERNQILARIDQWVDDLFSVGADLSDLASSRSAWKPLRCAWVCRDDQQRWAAEAAPALPHTPIVLISASIPNARGRKRLCLDSHDKSRFNSSVTPIGRGLDHQGASISADTSESPPSRGGVAWQPIDVMFDYIPGAGDDEESWAKGMGLTPDIVWNHWKEILSAGPEGATEVVKHALRQQKRQARREMGRGDAEMNRGSQDRMYLGVDHPVLHPPPRVVWIGNTNLGLCSLHSSFLAVDHKDTGTSVDYPWDPSDAVINVSSADLLESAPQVGEPLAVDEIPACSDPKSSSSVFPDLPKLFIDKSDSFLLGKHYLWLPKAAYRGEKRSLLRHIPAAVTFASGHLSAGRRVVVVGEASNSVDIAACALLSCLIACFKLLEGDNGGPWMLEWSNSCDVNWETLTVKAVEGDRFSRLTVRQYAASSISLWAPEVVLPKMLLKQVFNAFLPNRMTAPGRRLE